MERRLFNVARVGGETPVPPLRVPAEATGEPPARGRTPARQLLQDVLHAGRSDGASFAIVGLIGGLFAVSSFLLWSWPGVFFAVLMVGALAAGAPFLPPETTMRLYRAEPMDLRNGLPFYRIADSLAARAGLTATPKLYVIPSLTVNAFAAGQPSHAAIALTEGLLRRLSLSEAGAVMAHEIGHIANDDLRVMARADVMTRVMQVMWVAAIALAALSLPGYLTGQSRLPWLPICLLFLTPVLGNVLQMALSRRREFDADLDAVRLTGDPKAVTAALQKVDRHRGGLVEDLLFPSRRIPMPSLLRSHPATRARLARLDRIEALPQNAPLALEEAPMVTMVGRGPSSLRPRYRITGLWF